MSKDKSSSPARVQRILETEFVKEALDRLSDGLGAREPFLLVTGGAGTGKTTLVRAAMQRWGDRATVAFVADPAMNRTELLEEIVRRFGVEPPAGATKPQLLASLETAVAAAKRENRVPVVVIDDAHEVSPELLGELRLLVNVSAQAEGPLEIVLAGLPALDRRLAEPAFDALRQRVGVHVVAQPFSAHQSRRYVHEIAAAGEKDPASLFPKKTCRELHACSQGVPRTLNTLTAVALRLAKKSGEAAVSTQRVAEAADSLGLERVASTGRDEQNDSPATGIVAPVRAVHDDAPAKTAAAREAPGAGSAGKGGDPLTSDAAHGGTEEPAPPARAAGPVAPDDHEPIARPPHDPETDGELKPPGDPAKVVDWVGRFISPDEPRFGDLIGTGRAEFTDEFGATEISEDPAVDEVLAKLRRRRGRVLPRYRRGRRQRPEWLGTVALLLVIVAALVTLAGPTKRVIVAGMNAMSASAERSAQEQAARAVEERSKETIDPPAAEPAGDPGPAEPRKPEASSARNPAPAPGRRATGPAPSPETSRAAVRAAAPEPYQPPATTPDVAVAATASDPDQLWALDVGAHTDPGAAGMDRERLVEATGLKGWLVRSSEGGITRYRVVLGIYSTRDRAEGGSHILLDKGLVGEATVIPLPPRGQRQ